jgi:ABC-type nickel/cobalt efflux system permease component RcnA
MFSFLVILPASILAYSSDDEKLKTLFVLSIGSVFLMISIIIYLCYRNINRYRNRGHVDLEHLDP